MLNPDYKIEQLDNGLKVIMEEIPYLRSVSVGFLVGAGSKNENKDNTGISHFIEHMQFKGTAKRSAFDIAQDIFYLTIEAFLEAIKASDDEASASYQDFVAIDGIGPKVAASIVDFFKEPHNAEAVSALLDSTNSLGMILPSSTSMGFRTVKR